MTNGSGCCSFRQQPSWVKTQQKRNFFLVFCFFLCEDIFTIPYFSRLKGFSYYFRLMKEGSGSVSLTKGSGRAKNIRILLRIWFGTLFFKKEIRLDRETVTEQEHFKKLIWKRTFLGKANTEIGFNSTAGSYAAVPLRYIYICRDIKKERCKAKPRNGRLCRATGGLTWDMGH